MACRIEAASSAIPTRRLTTIVAPSGAGKSTLLRLSGLYPAINPAWCGKGAGPGR